MTTSAPAWTSSARRWRLRSARSPRTLASRAPSSSARSLENKGDYAYGYDAQGDAYGDMFKLGIIDPTKVVRTAIQDAASVAGLLITTEAMVAEKPKKEAAAPAMPGGGMDF